MAQMTQDFFDFHVKSDMFLFLIGQYILDLSIDIGKLRDPYFDFILRNDVRKLWWEVWDRRS